LGLGIAVDEFYECFQFLGSSFLFLFFFLLGGGFWVWFLLSLLLFSMGMFVVRFSFRFQIIFVCSLVSDWRVH
jgi:hypothetical protein